MAVTDIVVYEPTIPPKSIAVTKPTVIEGEYREIPAEKSPKAKKAKPTIEQRIEAERQHNIQREAELKHRKELRAETERKQKLKMELAREKVAYAFTPVKTAGQTVAPYARQAYMEAKPVVKQVAKEAWRGTTGFISRRVGGPITARFVITPKGVNALKSYYNGDYSTIPPDSIRSYLLEAAYKRGAFVLAAAVNTYGTDGAIAANLLAEARLIQRA